MASKTALVLLAIVAGGIAFPTLDPENSIFYQHADPNARIVGGTTAAEGAHPHMASLSSGALIRSFLCGGSIITSRTVLTAAHCISAVFSLGTLVDTLRVGVGSNRWNQGATLYTLSRNVTHPNYFSPDIKNDIGILVTSTDIAMSDVVRPIALNFDYQAGGVPVIVAGWGRIIANGALSATLLELNLETINGEQCVADAIQAGIDFNTRPPPVDPVIEICTYHSPGHGTCNGDSGSALALVENGQQVGIVSWGFPCARGAPDMFVRVSAYREWLQEVVV